MGNIKLLDCTLRDGGYINDWKFGEDAIPEMISALEKTNVDILELGFLKNEPYKKDRTVFNSMEQVKALLRNKRRGTQYAVMCEVVNPLPLSMLEPADEESADIIRVIVWKTKHTADGEEVDALRDGYEYCRGIVEKGYKLCVQPARVDQYSDSEFADMVRKFSQLNPLALYVVDSWGTMYSDKLLHYMSIADEILPESVAIGYHGHNNMQQAFDVAKDFCALKLNRDMFIDASVDGMGRGAGNLDSFTIARYLNREFGAHYHAPYFSRLSEKYIEDFKDIQPWGYSMPYYLTAINNCNPNYATYYSHELNLPAETIDGILPMISPEDRIIYTKEKADRYLKKYRKTKLNMVIVVPTYNRPASIDYTLFTAAKTLWEYGVDIVIFDSSSNSKTEAVTLNFQIDGYDNVIYRRYTGNFDGLTIDEKVINAFSSNLDGYDYIWAIRDGLVPALDTTYEKLVSFAQKGTDYIVVDSSERNGGCRVLKEYDDYAQFFVENGIRLATLGTFIVKTSAMRAIIRNNPLNEKNYGFWIPAAPLCELARSDYKVLLFIDDIFTYNPKGTYNSFWNKSGAGLETWARLWYIDIVSLPEIYDGGKSSAMKIEMCDFHPFYLSSLLRMRGNGGLSIALVKKYKEYFPHVGNTPMWKYYLAAVFPKRLARAIVNNPQSRFMQWLNQLYQKLRRYE